MRPYVPEIDPEKGGAAVSISTKNSWKLGDALHLGVQGEPGFVSYPWREDGVDPGGEAIVTSPATVVTVVASGALPVGGPIALMLLCSAMAVVGRRKK